ncbi:hypothetical protein [Gracilimonas tropica]|uniref:hypothetical protein n=1 Tax=Gracilimonas tropica TaxID=454600 RepID=UPI000362F9BF|nr:hypothetical protein [Gracilimonas tropica]
MARSFQELRKLTKKELIEEYDKIATSTRAGLSFLADEIQRRENQETNDRIVKLTAQMKNLTIAITFLTIVNLIVLILDKIS